MITVSDKDQFDELYMQMECSKGAIFLIKSLDKKTITLYEILKCQLIIIYLDILTLTSQWIFPGKIASTQIKRKTGQKYYQIIKILNLKNPKKNSSII